MNILLACEESQAVTIGWTAFPSAAFAKNQSSRNEHSTKTDTGSVMNVMKSIKGRWL